MVVENVVAAHSKSLSQRMNVTLLCVVLRLGNGHFVKHLVPQVDNEAILIHVVSRKKVLGDFYFLLLQQWKEKKCK